MGDGAARPDMRLPNEWYQSSRGNRGPRRRLPRGLVGAISFALVAGAIYAGGGMLGLDPTSSSRDTVNNLLDDIPLLPPLPPDPGSPTPGPTVSPGPGGRPDPTSKGFKERYRRIANEHPDVVEGRDYSFIHKVKGAPVHWSCAETIPVVLAGKVPAGAEESFTQVVEAIASVSNLPLRAERAVGGRSPTAGELVVYYGKANSKPGSFSVGDTALGRGGPRFYELGPRAGMIDSGEVVVRNDVPEFLPTTRGGQHVLAHEVMHALGIGHSEKLTPELMAPVVGEIWPEFGRGDRVALQMVGCDEA